MTRGFTSQGYSGDEASPDWCHSCLKLEPLPDEYYSVCGECGHVYVTAEELLEAENRLLFEMQVTKPPVVTDPEHVYTCPLCGHDF